MPETRSTTQLRCRWFDPSIAHYEKAPYGAFSAFATLGSSRRPTIGGDCDAITPSRSSWFDPNIAHTKNGRTGFAVTRPRT